jgi:hypothetical protein
MLYILTGKTMRPANARGQHRGQIPVPLGCRSTRARLHAKKDPAIEIYPGAEIIPRIVRLPPNAPHIGTQTVVAMRGGSLPTAAMWDHAVLSVPRPYLVEMPRI